MEKIKEIRMTLVILIVGLFFISGCFFNNNKTITFKSNGGSEIKNITVKNGSKLEDAPVPTKDGYIFDGWYLDGVEYNFDKVIEDDITLVAKWIRDTKNSETTEESNTEEVTTTTTTTTTKTGVATAKMNSTKKTTKKKKTTTSKKTTSTTKKTTTSKKTTTAAVLTPELEQSKPALPVITPTPEPVESDEKVVKNVDLKIEVIKEEVEDKEKKDEYIKITKINKDTNVISNIEDTDLEELLTTKEWIITSNHALTYEYTEIDGVIELKGDTNVTSFTVSYNDKSVIFDYDEVDNHWIIKYPTVSVGTGLDIIYYKDINTAVGVAKENETIRLLENQEVNDSLEILVPVTIDADNHKITNKEGYLFNLEKIIYTKESKFEVNNLVLEVDSFIYVGKSKFDNIILNNITGNIKGERIDKKENGEFENTSILQHF